MKIATMRRIDRTVGSVACAVLTVARRLTDPLRARPRGPVERVLLIKLAEQGATVVAYDAIAQAVALVGPGNVTLLVFAENRAIADELGVLEAEDIIAVDASSALGLLRALPPALRSVRARRVDAAIDLEGFSRLSVALAFLSGARRRVGWHPYHGVGGYRGDLLTHRVAANPRLHAADAFSSLIDALGADPTVLPALDPPARARHEPPPLAPSREEVETVERMVEAALAVHPGGPLVLLNPNGGDLLPLRRWPEERYVAVARELLERRPDLAIIVTGAPREAGAARRVVRSVGSRRCASLAGATTLRQLLVLYGLAEVLVTNDSGPAHYAALTPIDVVVLFGPESPEVFGPRSARSHALTARLPCSPCVNVLNDRQTSCTNNLCMQAIGVDEVLATVEAILEARAATPSASAAGRPRA